MEPLMHPDGRVGHAELKIGDSLIMLADEFPEMDARGPETVGGSPVSLHLYVEDVDKTAIQLTSAGGKIKRPVRDQFYGDRTGSFVDPFGHIWHVATHIEDVSPQELRRRAAEAMKQQAAD
jgi:PhnB protein